MIYRTPSGQVIGSTKPKKTHSIDPTCWPTTAATEIRAASSAPTVGPSSGAIGQPPIGQSSSRASTSYCLESLPSFPRTLFEWKTYDGARALTAFLFLLATLYFFAGFLGFLVDHTPWLADLFHRHATETPPKAVWWQFWNAVGSTVANVGSYVDLAFRLFVFLCAYCLTWATFDPRNIEGYVMGFFNTCLGLAYMLAPVDVIPDFVPVAGTLDDMVLGAGVLLLGLSSLYRNKLRDVKTQTIVDLIDDGNNQKALQMLLEDKGITITNQQSDTQQS